MKKAGEEISTILNLFQSGGGEGITDMINQSFKASIDKYSKSRGPLIHANEQTIKEELKKLVSTYIDDLCTIFCCKCTKEDSDDIKLSSTHIRKFVKEGLQIEYKCRSCLKRRIILLSHKLSGVSTGAKIAQEAYNKLILYHATPCSKCSKHKLSWNKTIINNKIYCRQCGMELYRNTINMQAFGLADNKNANSNGNMSLKLLLRNELETYARVMYNNKTFKDSLMIICTICGNKFPNASFIMNYKCTVCKEIK